MSLYKSNLGTNWEYIYFPCLWKSMSNSFIYLNSPISINLDSWWRLVFPTTLWQICNARNKNVFKDQGFETMIIFHRIRTLSTDSLLLTPWVILWWPANSHMKHHINFSFFLQCHLLQALYKINKWSSYKFYYMNFYFYFYFLRENYMNIWIALHINFEFN